VIKTLFRYVAYALITLITLFLILFAYGRLRGPTPEQQAALALLDKRPSFKPEQNLAPYLWLLEYDVPSEKIVEIAASDVERFNRLTDSKQISAYKSQAEGRYPKINYHEDALSQYCQFTKQKSCLVEIEANQQKVRALLDKSKNLIDRVERMHDYRVHFSDMAFHLEGPIPKYQTGRALLRVHYADMFIRGQHDKATDGVCKDIQFWRAIGSNSDNLIGAMVGYAYVRQDLNLLSEMLQRTNADSKLPESCALALKPVDYTENMICNAMRGEFLFLKNLDLSTYQPITSTDNISSSLEKWAMPVLYSHKQSNAAAARRYALACSNAAISAAKNNQPYALVDDQIKPCDGIDLISNAGGCLINDLATPVYQKYSNRRLDQSAQITAMQIYVWLREQKIESGSTKDRFNSRPKHLTSFSDRIRFNDKTNAIEVDLLAPASDNKAVWSLLLVVTAAPAAPKR
jgi:hypothetical protein